MTTRQSYFSRPYAPAWGILIGTAVGMPIDLLVSSSGVITGSLSMLGLTVGTVLYYEGEKPSARRSDPSPDRSGEARLRDLEHLRRQSLISDQEYERKRAEVLSDL